jgi:hypothetical protein
MLDGYEELEDRLEKVTRKWWLVLLFVLLAFIIPPYASKGYSFPEKCEEVGLQGLANPICPLDEYRVVFKVVPLVLLVSLVLLPAKVGPIFNIYVALTYIFFALYHGIGKTETYGVIINPGNLTMFLTVSAVWFWEVLVRRNDFSNRKQPLWKYWIAPLVLLAFWFPVSKETGMPDFNPVYLFANKAGLAFCPMTPLYVGVLTIYYPTVNQITLRVSSIVGLGGALVNLYLQFVRYPGLMWWIGVLHLPLLIICSYGLVISLRERYRNNLRVLSEKRL